jgi:beta-lactamase regulating signal transducer with metallopeptidase domain
MDLYAAWSSLLDATVKASVLILLAWVVSKLWRPAVQTQRNIWVGVTYAILLIAITSATSLAQWKVSVPVAAPAPVAVSAAPPTDPSFPVEHIVLAAWAIVAAILLTGVIAAHLRLRRTLSRCSSVDVPADVLETLSSASGVKRSWTLLQGTAATGPFTCGALAPKIVLPDTWRSWPEPQVRSVLLHELFHVRAADVAAQNAAVIVCCIQWFNPLAWIALAKLRNACEAAADSAVLQAGVPAPDYAEALLAIACVDTRKLRPIALPFGSRSLPERIGWVLESGRLAKPAKRFHCYAVGIPLILSTGVLASGKIGTEVQVAITEGFAKATTKKERQKPNLVIGIKPSAKDKESKSFRLAVIDGPRTATAARPSTSRRGSAATTTRNPQEGRTEQIQPALESNPAPTKQNEPDQTGGTPVYEVPPIVHEPTQRTDIALTAEKKPKNETHTPEQVDVVTETKSKVADEFVTTAVTSSPTDVAVQKPPPARTAKSMILFRNGS